MIEPPNWIWKCDEEGCSEQEPGYQDERETSIPPKCKTHNREMTASPIVQGGPEHGKHPFKHY